MSAELIRHVNALVSEFAAEYGELDVVGRRVDCEPDERDALVGAFEAFGVVGGAGIRVRDDARMLFVRYEGTDSWVDPGDSRRPGESYRECARRGVRETTGIEATIDDLDEIHLLYADDWTDRDPIPNPYVSFEGRPTRGDTRPGADVAELRWAETVPETLLYDELAELSLGE